MRGAVPRSMTARCHTLGSPKEQAGAPPPPQTGGGMFGPPKQRVGALSGPAALRLCGGVGPQSTACGTVSGANVQGTLLFFCLHRLCPPYKAPTHNHKGRQNIQNVGHPPNQRRRSTVRLANASANARRGQHQRRGAALPPRWRRRRRRRRPPAIYRRGHHSVRVRRPALHC